ncbi:Uncharacterized protein conserved in bacteria [Metamycoplasma arthritidis]|uniref:Probable cell division protein WhiA n=1 Tax=Metamycoplasma arthritidis (strain 158L3-1) TaxID=243272 RepID=B3PN51_META1|nr:DNA-binding protein WhiA [Metamycoplasma arthritidis]ACF07453.1 conserved hypothetical protein [Metamycoplasma arthritidis 158L3-1]VEU78974.1 Uncharacterized protein conserved in bacteria [Metamycoplasma arthritidis]
MKSTFSLIIKNEIISRKLNEKEKLNLLFGILATTQKTGDLVTLIINNNEILNYVQNILSSLKISFQMPQKNKLVFSDEGLNFLGCPKQRDYFSGIFLIGGSINGLNSSSYHLELKFLEQEEAKEAQQILNKYNFEFKLLKRRNSYILYIKKIENICDFLKAIEAYESYLNFEEKKIERDFSNNINRLTNFDFFNQERIAKLNSEFIENFEYVKSHNLFDKFSQNELDFFKYKENNLDLSLQELSKLLVKEKNPKSKGTLHHYLKKLKDVVKKTKEEHRKNQNKH